MLPPCLVAVMGPTASGKTAFAEALSDETGFQLINADAFQVYRWLDIGTGKSARRREYLMMDLAEPREQFGAGQWLQQTSLHLAKLFEEERGAIIVGGTLYYVRALFEGYTDMRGAPPEKRRVELDLLSREELLEILHNREPEALVGLDTMNRVRVQRAVERTEALPISWETPAFRKVKLILDADPDTLRTRITQRVDDMMAEGWLDEVSSLPRHGVEREDPGMRAHGYRALWDVVFRGSNRDEARVGIASEVAQYAKRQRTWLRKEPNGVKMPSQDEGNALAAAKAMILGV